MTQEVSKRVFVWVLCLGLLAQMGLSPRLWLGPRHFPTAPVLPFLSSPDAVTILFAIAIVSLLAWPSSRYAAIAVLAGGVVLVCLDFNRLQPWFWQDLVLFAVLAFSGSRSLLGFVLAATYFWSGLQKLNASFEWVAFPWLMKPLGFSGLWWLIPVIECGVGVCLFIPKARPAGLVGAAVIHIFNLVVLGPFGHGYNSVVWPWNVTMPALAFLIFYRFDGHLLPEGWFAKGVVVLVGVMPALSLFGWWDENLSDSLYSGKTPTAFLVFPPDQVPQADYLRPYLQNGRSTVGLNVTAWAIGELNVPPYSADWAYEAVAKQIGGKLRVTRRPTLLNGGLFDPNPH